MSAGKKIEAPTHLIQIRLFKSDVELLRDIYPGMGISEAIRLITARHCQQLRAKLDKEIEKHGRESFGTVRQEPSGSDQSGA